MSKDLYEVEEILDRRYNPITKQYEYLIKWKGYSSDQNTWEPTKHLQGLKEYVKEFDITQEPLYQQTMKKLLKEQIIKFMEENKPPRRQEVTQNDQEQNQFEIPIELQTHNSHKLGRGFTWAQEEQAHDLNIDY